MQIFISKAFRKESEDIFDYISSKSISGAVKCKNGMSQYINTLKKISVYRKIYTRNFRQKL